MVFYIVGVGGVIFLVVAGILVNSLLSDYNAVSSKVAQVETFKKMSINRQGIIDRYEEEVTQLSNTLAHIQHLKAYANAQPLRKKLVDPRFYRVSRAQAPYLEYLTGLWATDPQYGLKLKQKLRALEKYL